MDSQPFDALRFGLEVGQQTAYDAEACLLARVSRVTALTRERTREILRAFRALITI